MPSLIGNDEGEGYGVLGESEEKIGVQGLAGDTGVKGSGKRIGVEGESSGYAGLKGVNYSETGYAVVADNIGWGPALIAFSQGINETIRAVASGKFKNTNATEREPIAVHGVALNQGWGVVGSGDGGKGWPSGGVKGESELLEGVLGISKNNTGVRGHCDLRSGGEGVKGTGFIGVQGTSTYGPRGRGEQIGESQIGIGVVGEGNFGVYGKGFEYGVYGIGADAGVAAQSKNVGVNSKGKIGVQTKGDTIGILTSGKIGVFAAGTNYAMLSIGRVMTIGTLSVAGSKNFKLDHPLEPEKKYLNHSTVESSEMKNVYDGVVKLNRSGSAVVKLPKWFEALNKDFRYQLTAVGGAAPNLHISKTVKDNSFEISGGSAGLEVCWQITGVRNDAYAKQNPLKVEETKPKNEQGKYLHPECFGKKPSQSIFADIEQKPEQHSKSSK